MKKYIKIFSIVFLMLFAFGSLACKKPPKPDDGGNGGGEEEEFTCVLGDWVEEVHSTCTENGTFGYYQCKDCGKYYDKDKNEIYDITMYAHHETRATDNLTYGTCIYCGQSVLNGSGKTVESQLKTTPMYEKYDEIIANAKTLGDKATEKTLTEEEWSAWIDDYDVAYENLLDSYYYLSLKWHLYQDDESEEKYNGVEDIYTSMRDALLKFIAKVYDSEMKEKFINLEYFTQEDLDYIDENIEMFRNEELVSLKEQIDDLEVLLQKGYDQVSGYYNKYLELVELRNKMAKILGYDNYYDYGQTIYGRVYVTSDIENMRAYYKDNLASIMKLASKSASEFVDSYKPKATQKKTYEALYKNDFTAKDSLAFVKQYLKQMVDEANGIDFFAKVNNALSNGLVAFGTKYEGAYAQTNARVPYMYFQIGSGYSDPFTFIHESGHYNLSVDPVLDDYDLYEIHSQGNEQLFARYMINYCKEKGYTDLINYIHSKLVSDWSWTLGHTLVCDAFEEAVYKGYYPTGAGLQDGISAGELETLMKEIAKDFKYDETLGQSYSYYTQAFIKFYFAKNSLYPLSYSMSLIPAIEIYVMSATDYEGAKAAYFKLYSYINDESFTAEETFVNILAYAGLSSPFEEETYKTIAKFLDENK